MIRIRTIRHGKWDNDEPQKITSSLGSYSPKAMREALLKRHEPSETSVAVRAALGEVLEKLDRLAPGSPPPGPAVPDAPTTP